MVPSRRAILPILCLGILTSAPAAEILQLRADSWLPYNGDPDDAAPGYTIEIARTVLGPKGIQVDYQNMAWGDALKAAAAGEIDAVVGANRDEAAGLICTTETVGLPRVALITKKDSTWQYQNVLSLHSVRIAVLADYKYWPALDTYVAKSSAPKVTVFSGDHPLDDAIAALQRGDVDVVAETSSVFSWALKRLNANVADFRIVYLHEGDPIYFAFKPQGDTGKRYAALLDAGIRELRKNGKLAEILSRYGLKDWQQ